MNSRGEASNGPRGNTGVERLQKVYEGGLCVQPALQAGWPKNSIYDSGMSLRCQQDVIGLSSECQRDVTQRACLGGDISIWRARLPERAAVVAVVAGADIQKSTFMSARCQQDVSGMSVRCSRHVSNMSSNRSSQVALDWRECPPHMSRHLAALDLVSAKEP